MFYVLLSLDAGTGDVTVEEAVFLTVNSDGVTHSRTFVLRKLAAEAAVVTMRDVEAVLIKRTHRTCVQVQLLKL